MDLAEAVAVVLREDATDKELMQAVQVCLNLGPEDTVRHVLRKGLEACRSELTATITHTALQNNPSLKQKACLYAEQKLTQDRDKVMRQKLKSTTRSEPKKKQ